MGKQSYFLTDNFDTNVFLFTSILIFMFQNEGCGVDQNKIPEILLKIFFNLFYVYFLTMLNTSLIPKLKTNDQIRLSGA